MLRAKLLEILNSSKSHDKKRSEIFDCVRRYVHNGLSERSAAHILETLLSEQPHGSSNRMSLNQAMQLNTAVASSTQQHSSRRSSLNLSAASAAATPAATEQQGSKVDDSPKRTLVAAKKSLQIIAKQQPNVSTTRLLETMGNHIKYEELASDVNELIKFFIITLDYSKREVAVTLLPQLITLLTEEIILEGANPNILVAILIGVLKFADKYPDHRNQLITASSAFAQFLEDNIGSVSRRYLNAAHAKVARYKKLLAQQSTANAAIPGDGEEHVAEKEAAACATGAGATASQGASTDDAELPLWLGVVNGEDPPSSPNAAATVSAAPTADVAALSAILDVTGCSTAASYQQQRQAPQQIVEPPPGFAALATASPAATRSTSSLTGSGTSSSFGSPAHASGEQPRRNCSNAFAWGKS